MSEMSRRNFFRLALGTTLPFLTGCSAHRRIKEEYNEAMHYFEPDDRFQRLVLRSRSPAGPAVLLLHELPGLTPEDMLLGYRIAQQGFQVYLPVLFGKVGQD